MDYGDDEQSQKQLKMLHGSQVGRNCCQGTKERTTKLHCEPLCSILLLKSEYTSKVFDTNNMCAILP